MSDPTLFDRPSNGERLFLADALALAYRAHFAFISRPLTDPSGNEISAAYGFTGSLIKLLEDEKPEHIAVVFDAIDGVPTFRDEIYAEYKSNRPPMPEGIRYSLPYIKRIVEAFDIPVLEVSGVEADDVIGTLAKSAEAEDVNVIIFSADKDFRQLISENVSMLRPAYKGEEFNQETLETFREKYDGLDPHQFIDLLALMGDAADNVPGIPGIGEKTAVKLIKEYGSVEKLLENADAVKGKRAREGLQNYPENAELSKRLVTIDTEVPLKVDWHQLRRTSPNLEEVDSIFDELGFGTRLRTRVKKYYDNNNNVSDEKPEVEPTLEFATGELDFGESDSRRGIDLSAVNYSNALNADELENVAGRIDGVSPLALDTETTSRDSMYASLVGLSFSTEADTAWYVPTPMPDGTPTEDVLEKLRQLLENPDTLYVGHNIKYDLMVLARHGIQVQGEVFDTMVAHYLIAPEESHSMDSVSMRVLEYKPQPISDLIGEGRDQKNMRDIPIADAGPYACEDADVTLKLYAPLKERLEQDGLGTVAHEIEFPLIHVLTDMELAGVKVDAGVLARISAELGEEAARLEGEIYAAVGREFNIGSPQQLGDVLFNQLKLPAKKKTAGGAFSTREEVLSELATEHELPRLVLDWRSVSKLKNTYVDKLPELINPETGRIHTSFNQTIAATGRLSSSNPGLQNIPVRSESGREIRKAFIADEGHVLLCADYAQIELRILASMAEDEGLTQAFLDGHDIHAATAASVFGIPIEEVTRTQRSHVKQVNYGIPYGISAFGLAQRLRISNSEAADLIAQYRQSYPGVIRLLSELVEVASEKGYAETLIGRRRYIPDLRSNNPRLRSAGERIAVNMPIQGTQADMIKRAMVRIHRRIKQENLRMKMLLQVHDELVFEVPEDEVDVAKKLVREEMSGALPLNVPVEVDIGIGSNWLEAH